jgi:succinoglycan biosynthesis protein ExoO
VLGLARALKAAGFAVDYIGATPKIFGRWAVMRLKPEIDAFDRYCIPGGLRLGRLVFSLNPSVWLASSLVVLERIAARLGLPVRLSRPADYAQAAYATRADMLFVARRAAPGARAVLCDYAYLAPVAPFALSPEAPALVIMHDLISERVADPALEAATGKVARLEKREEMALLSLADAVIAIQSDEAHKVRTALPALSVLTAPHGVEPSPAPQPGLDDTLLFVGSNTAPNIVGLQRFFASAWPVLKTLRPHAELLVAGSVDRGLRDVPEGVRLLGVVDDLTQLYRDAGVVISPLYTGSGLKIKLIEAMAAGKAVVASSVTTQGVERLVGGAVVVADEPEEFARAAADLMADADARERLGLASLQCTKAHFSAGVAFSEVLTYVSREAHRSPRPAPLAAASTS